MFEGVYTAIVTPFDKDGKVNYETLKELVEFQIEGGVDGIVPVGTTGESSTLSVDEHNKVIETVLETAKGRALVIAGTGANSTAEAVELTKHARDAGADGTLQVTPYYNKPSQKGLVEHFSAVADLGLPTVLYNVPGRTGREISIDTILKLAEHPAVVAVKEAGGSVDRVSSIVRQCDLDVLSGDDALTWPMMAVGAVGVISVTTNIAPRQIAQMVHLILEGQWAEASELHLKYHQLFGDMFLDTNPIPVKAALAMMGKIEEVYRLPLCPMEQGLKDQLAETMREVGIL